MRPLHSGPSGAGKTTLAGLLNRLYDPTKGQVLLDGTDLRNVSFLNYAKECISSPEPFLFDDTIKENIELGQSIHTAGSLEDSIEKCKCLGFRKFNATTAQRIGEKAAEYQVVSYRDWPWLGPSIGTPPFFY